MQYVVEYRYVDHEGVERVVFDGFDRLTITVIGARCSATDGRVCVYTSKRPATDVKRLIDGMLEDMRRRKMAKKIWKAKIIRMPSELTPSLKVMKMWIENAALRYYYSFCI